MPMLMLYVSGVFVYVYCFVCFFSCPRHCPCSQNSGGSATVLGVASGIFVRGDCSSSSGCAVTLLDSPLTGSVTGIRSRLFSTVCFTWLLDI